MVDKVLIIVLMFLIAGMGIAITRNPSIWPMFYAMVGGAIIVIIYSARQTRKRREKERRERRKFKK